MIQQLRKIKRELVKSGYPELRFSPRPIYISMSTLDEETAATFGNDTPGYDIITVDHFVDTISLEARVGLIAHELAHCVIDRRRGQHWGAIMDFLYPNSKTIKRYEENSADRMTVERGYGKCLLQFKQEVGEEGYGLTNTEILRMIESGRYPLYSVRV
ncbi:hypothetical protein HY496_02450 [Candidatus Woesearchaeota archaeon]|nr:hypothetical protein [Candidatus Woesearchaeota archaeon]